MISFGGFLSDVDCDKEGVIREEEGETLCAFQSSEAKSVYFF